METRKALVIGSEFAIYGFAGSQDGKRIETFRDVRVKLAAGSRSLRVERLDVTFPNTRAGSKAASEWSLSENLAEIARNESAGKVVMVEVAEGGAR